MSLQYTLIKKDKKSKARLGEMTTSHGSLPTPLFMPVGTRGAVKTLTNRQLAEMGVEMILGNTYHLMLRPGTEIIEKAGGLHQFMKWDGSILTDSGGFQVFSLSSLNKVTDEGVYFQSHIDGSRHFLGPEESMNIQRILGSDIVMAFDECSPYPCERSQVEAGMERTFRWAKTCRDYGLQQHQSLFAITQGGMHADLRKQSTQELASLPFDGFAIGGLSVGEPAEMMNEMIEVSEPYLPENKPRYLMGVGTPRNIIEAVMRGIDLFDCVLPTRNARNGTAYTWSGKIVIKGGKFADDFSPLDPQLDCYASQFSKAYIRHLLNVDEVTGLTLVTMQNLAFYFDLMDKIRKAIESDTLDELYEKICQIYPN